MVEDKIRVINDLDIQIKDLEEEIKNTKSINDEIKLNIQKNMLILQQIDAILDTQEA